MNDRIESPNSARFFGKQALKENPIDEDKFAPETPPLALEPYRHKTVKINGVPHWRCPLCGWTTSDPIYISNVQQGAPWGCRACFIAAAERTTGYKPKPYLDLCKQPLSPVEPS